MRVVIFFLLNLISLASAARLTFSVPPSSLVANPSTLPPTTQATLFRLDHTLKTLITRRNTFEFSDVSPGSYLLTVQCRDYAFGPLRVDVVKDGEEGSRKEKVEVHQTFWGNEWGNKGEWRGGGESASRSPGDEDDEVKAVVVEVKPERRKEFYAIREGFSPLQFFKSPMILMALFSLGLIIGMPYVMDSMDEETRAEFEELQKRNPISQASSSAQGLQNFDLASWMAGKSSS